MRLATGNDRYFLGCHTHSRRKEPAILVQRIDLQPVVFYLERLYRQMRSRRLVGSWIAVLSHLKCHLFIDRQSVWTILGFPSPVQSRTQIANHRARETIAAGLSFAAVKKIVLCYAFMTRAKCQAGFSSLGWGWGWLFFFCKWTVVAGSVLGIHTGNQLVRFQYWQVKVNPV